MLGILIGYIYQVFVFFLLRIGNRTPILIIKILNLKNNKLIRKIHK